MTDPTKPCRRGHEVIDRHLRERSCCSNCTRPRPADSEVDQVDPAGSWVDATGHRAGYCSARVELLTEGQMRAMDEMQIGGV